MSETEGSSGEYPEAVLSHDGEQVKQVVQHLFEIAGSGDCSMAAQFIAYRGDDMERKWKDSYQYEVEEEQMKVDRACADLKRMLEGLDHFEFIEFSKEAESEGEWNVWEMKFHYADGSAKDVVMAFLRVQGHYMLGDID